MQRRNALKLLAGAATLPLLSRDALAFFRSLQTQVTEKPDLKTFTPAQNAMVETMSELIIPATDTPGAKGARVSEFIDLILSDWSDDADKKIFLDGLADVDQRSQGLFGKNFVESTVAQQTEVMRVLDEELVKAQSHIEPNRDGRRVLAREDFLLHDEEPDLGRLLHVASGRAGGIALRNHSFGARTVRADPAKEQS